MSNPQVTILIPHYKTLTLTTLCLRLIRKHTDPSLAKVLVIDNGSADESTDYLRSLKWIDLIIRQPTPSESPILSHSRALDLALECVTTPYVLSIHTDTLVRNAEWLPFLLNQIQKNTLIAGVGSWKLESKPLWKKIIKLLESFLQRNWDLLRGKKERQLEGLDHNHHYLRSHCALYRTDLIRQCHTGFSDGDDVAGKVMHHKLIQHGYQMVFLTSDELLGYMAHINHATTVLNPNLSRNQKSVTKGMRRIQKSLDSFDANTILMDTSLDG